MLKLSIIIPIYQVEKYLEKCLESATNQTIDQYEIVLINDGSKDGSEKIAKQYLDKYPEKIRYFYQENAGQASARNLGIKEAKGEYIAFLDSDDYVEKEAYQKVYEFAKEKDLDIVCFPFWEEAIGGKRIIQNDNWQSKENDIRYILNETSPCNKIIKREIFTKNQISFLESYIYEDLELIPRLLLYTDKVGYLDEPLYYYVIHEDSTMRQKQYNPKLQSIFHVMESLRKNFEKTKYKEELEMLFIEHLLHGAGLRFLGYEEGKVDVEKISSMLKMYYPNWRKNKYYQKETLKYKIVCYLLYTKRIELLKKLLKK